MIGIVSYGSYLPVNRIQRETIFKAMGWLHQAPSMKGEKCVANFDEDSITMAVASSMNCLEDRNRQSIEGLYFATTTSPFTERCGAGIIGTALDINSKISTFDFTGSTRAGTSALISAIHSISSGTAHSALVCASDMRLGKPGSSQELGFSDGAASLLIGDKDVIAEWEGSYSVSYDFPGTWRTANDTTDRAWEDRFGREEGYKKFIIESISGLMDKYKQGPGDINKIVFPGIYPRDHASICRTLGFGPDQIHDHLMNDMGNTGTSYPLMLLISALQEARPGAMIIIAGYGNGCDAMLFKVTDNIERIQKKKGGLKKSLKSKRELKSYEKYLAFRGLISPEGGIRAEAIPYTAMSLAWRDRREILGLCGTRCKECGTPQYPAQKVCVNPDCQAIDKMESYRFSDKKGKIFSFTKDLLSYTPNPPALYAVIDFDGGGRFWFDITDCDLDSLTIGTEVKMTLRRRYVDERGGIIGYFWKAVPIEV